MCSIICQQGNQLLTYSYKADQVDSLVCWLKSLPVYHFKLSVYFPVNLNSKWEISIIPTEYTLVILEVNYKLNCIIFNLIEKRC